MRENGNGRKRNAVLNTGASLVLQLVTAISGLILPRLIISAFGSEVNGLCASITQFLGYISLLQAGVEGVFRAALYKPLSDHDTERISGIVNDATGFYRKIALLFIPYVAGLCFLYPVFVDSSFDMLYIAALVLILSIGTFLQYYFSLSYISLINADQKVRITYTLDAAVLVLNLAATVVLIGLGFGIHAVKLCSCLVFAIKPAFYGWYVKKNYRIDKTARLSGAEVKQKWNGLVHHVAYFIHTNTDVFLLTVFVNTKTVSVYTVYYAIVTGIEKIINAVPSGSNAGIGNMLVTEQKEKIDDVFDRYEFIQSAITTVLFSITAILIIPFMQVYIRGVTDINYIQPAFAYILIFAEFLYCNRCIYSSATQNAGMYKETQTGAILECIVNFVISVGSVFRLGLIGIAIGTACGMGTRLVYEVLFLRNHVLNRPVRKAAKAFFVNMLLAAILVTPFAVFIRLELSTFFQWFVYAFAVSLYCSVVAAGVYLIFYRERLIAVMNGIKAKLIRR